MGSRIAERPVSQIRPGDHAAFSFTTAEEQAQVIGPFLHDGLDARHKVIYISGGGPRQLPGLAGRCDADRLAGTGQLRVIPRGAACLTRGRFDPDRMLMVIGREISLAAEQGYAAVRLTADMSWVLGQPGGYPLMLASEAGFDAAITPGAEIMAICQLDRARCAPEHLSALNDTHRIRVTPNPEFDDGVLRITRTHTPVGLRLSGELDAARHPPFVAALTALGEANTDIHLDFTDVRFLDLATLTLLVTHALRTQPGHGLVLDHLPPDVVRLIESLGWRQFPGLANGRPRHP
ncbi:MEDS domain-containing protein [Actinomadura sp. DC4]|uniref:MEDS domain-containing protein n=1 Tax=Actinomadura sp. DC4 TaxID=3055069 RepID=UPI0025B1938F|nr:MEDS domain-containing protein [Actinomadura sp. DC4]MDN3358655.1 MEDS domain-containing protein [Actinomadura sp. DC4]